MLQAIQDSPVTDLHLGDVYKLSPMSWCCLQLIPCQVPYCSVAMLEEVIEEDDPNLVRLQSIPSQQMVIFLQVDGGRSSPTSRMGGRTSPGGLSSMSTMSSMSRTTLRTPAPPPKVWRIVQPPFPPMTHTSVSTFDWKLLLDKE